MNGNALTEGMDVCGGKQQPKNDMPTYEEMVKGVGFGSANIRYKVTPHIYPF